MVFEDVHWIDPTSQEALDVLVPRLQALSVLLVITYRPEYTPPWAEQPHVTILGLSRLGRRQGAELVAKVTEGRALPAEVLEQIVAHTDGVPLFVEELTKSVLESGLLREGRRSVQAAEAAARAGHSDIAARLAAGAPGPAGPGEGHRPDRRLHRAGVLLRAARPRSRRCAASSSRRPCGS